MVSQIPPTPSILYRFVYMVRYCLILLTMELMTTLDSRVYSRAVLHFDNPAIRISFLHTGHSVPPPGIEPGTPSLKG